MQAPVKNQQGFFSLVETGQEQSAKSWDLSELGGVTHYFHLFNSCHTTTDDGMWSVIRMFPAKPFDCRAAAHHIENLLHTRWSRWHLSKAPIGIHVAAGKGMPNYIFLLFFMTWSVR